MNRQSLTKLAIVAGGAVIAAVSLTSCRMDSMVAEVESFLNEVSGSGTPGEWSSTASSLRASSSGGAQDSQYQVAHEEAYALGYAMGKLSNDEKFQAGYRVGYQAARDTFQTSGGTLVATSATLASPTESSLVKKSVPSWGYDSTEKVAAPEPVVEKAAPQTPSWKRSSNSRYRSYSRSYRSSRSSCAGGS